jgi:hypothetical protein
MHTITLLEAIVRSSTLQHPAITLYLHRDANTYLADHQRDHGGRSGTTTWERSPIHRITPGMTSSSTRTTRTFPRISDVDSQNKVSGYGMAMTIEIHKGDNRD